MTIKLKTLTPVHIGTGVNNPQYLYHQDEEYLDCYNIEDIIKQVPSYELMKLSPDDFKGNVGKQDLLNLFKRYVKYDSIQSKYYLYCFDELDKQDISEQIKTNSIPYIPGSSLKGVILNAINYDILVTMKEQVNKALSTIEANKRFEENLFKELFDYKYNDIIKMFNSCILCSDILFKNEGSMTIYKSERFNMGKGTSQMFSNLECIDYYLDNEGDFITIDDHRKKIFLHTTENKPVYDIYIKYFNLNNIFKACRNYFEACIKLEKEYFQYNKEYYDKEDIKMSELFPASLTDLNENECIIRLGKNTDYYFKSSTVFFKQYQPRYYNAHFDELFSPATRGKTRAKVDTMPKTRTIIYGYNSRDDQIKYYLAGMVRLELID